MFWGSFACSRLALSMLNVIYMVIIMHDFVFLSIQCFLSHKRWFIFFALATVPSRRNSNFTLRSFVNARASVRQCSHCRTDASHCRTDALAIVSVVENMWKCIVNYAIPYDRWASGYALSSSFLWYYYQWSSKKSGRRYGDEVS